MTDLNKEREAFEKLSEIAEILNEEKSHFNGDFTTYHSTHVQNHLSMELGMHGKKSQSSGGASMDFS